MLKNKLKWKSILSLSVPGVVMLALTCSVSAGYNAGNVSAHISFPGSGNSSWFSGTIGGVRNSPDTVSFITCSVTRTPRALASAQCTARSSDNRSAGCVTIDPGFVEVIRSITSSSTLHVTYNNNTGQCTNVVITNDSAGNSKGH